jgi:hypothetical protein
LKPNLESKFKKNLNCQFQSFTGGPATSSRPRYKATHAIEAIVMTYSRLHSMLQLNHFHLNLLDATLFLKSAYLAKLWALAKSKKFSYKEFQTSLISHPSTKYKMKRNGYSSIFLFLASVSKFVSKHTIVSWILTLVAKIMDFGYYQL